MTTQLLLNIPEARKARDKGIEKAINHANAVNENWGKIAYQKLKDFLSVHVGEFQAEDVRSHAAVDDDFPFPPSERSWGGVFVKAMHSGMIKKVGIGPVKNPKAHCANSNIYLKA